MSMLKNYFECNARNENGYCKLWLRQCVGGENCKQGYCAYCKYASISPKIEDSTCTKCNQFDFKKQNYIER